MNQNIIFADLQTWEPTRQAVSFPAQQAGALIMCWVSVSWLERQSATTLFHDADILTTFSQYRFDLEEIAESMIEEEEFNHDGEIVID